MFVGLNWLNSPLSKQFDKMRILNFGWTRGAGGGKKRQLGGKEEKGIGGWESAKINQRIGFIRINNDSRSNII